MIDIVPLPPKVAKSKRVAYCMEIDPAYVEVIVKRWEDFTGKKAELIVKGNE